VLDLDTRLQLLPVSHEEGDETDLCRIDLTSNDHLAGPCVPDGRTEAREGVVGMEAAELSKIHATRCW
jgi:hypothetical protein